MELDLMDNEYGATALISISSSFTDFSKQNINNLIPYTLMFNEMKNSLTYVCPCRTSLKQ
jgi:hypothetical protein